ncbi:MAG: SulP family inorganic anion transporter, partial [Pseudomonadota bacterium]|nr:SulP family inorganic anion transporter [Pseudomonadota bacterium]
LRLGFLANFLSHPVISGFITASGIIIAFSQLRGVLGIGGGGQTLPELATSMWADIGAFNWPTLVIGVSVTAFLFWSRKWLKPALMAYGTGARTADILAKAAPVVSVFATIAAARAFELEAVGVRIVGQVPGGLPGLTLSGFDLALWRDVALSALLISVVGFVESVSVAQTLAAKRRQRIDPDQELVGLGAANLASSLSGGYPVTGGFARSVVNFDAGAQTPAAGMFTAIGIAIATLVLTPLLFYLPRATLSATIIVAVLSLVDLGAIRRTWSYSKADGAAMVATIAITLVAGVEKGIVAGVGLSVFLHLLRSSRPHYAIVGQVPGTEHFRNIKRHEVATVPEILSIRVDESLYFANARYLEDTILNAVAANRAIRHVVLMCPAVNAIDSSALESLEAINHRLADSDVHLHLSEVKGPVMDRLRRGHFLDELTGKVFLTQFDALAELAPEITAETLAAPRRTAGTVVATGKN